MSKEFATKVLDSCYEKFGEDKEFCLSSKQFDSIVSYLCEDPIDYSDKSVLHRFNFYHYHGHIGPYYIEIEEYRHYHSRYSVKKFHKWIDEIPDPAKSEFQFKAKDKVELEGIIVYHLSYPDSYSRGQVHSYQYVDDSGNYFYFRTTREIEDLKVGARLRIKGTVKDHTNYNGMKSTTLTRISVA